MRALSLSPGIAALLFVVASAIAGCPAPEEEPNLEDDAGVVVDDAGCVGDLGCPCDADDACRRGQCVDGTCTLCTAGEDGCVCTPAGRCDDGLACQANNVCAACDPGSAGCTCIAGLCDEGLECQEARCVEAGCPLGQDGCGCRADLQNRCDDGGTCVDNRCQQCTGDQPGCPCLDDACANGLICDGTCRAPTTCAELVRDGFCVTDQVCNEGSGVDASCVPATCNEGFVFERGRCVPGQPNCQDGAPGSILATCTASFRTCVEVGDNATCGGCLGEGLEVDGACVGRLACGDTACSEQEYCDVTGGAPRCEPLPCAAGSARNANGVCQTCGFNCAGPGLTGRVWPFRAADSACVCETLPGFFLQAGGGTQAEVCDQDGDGWMRDAIVEPALISDAALAANARCGIASVDGVLLRDEHGLSIEVASCLEGLLINPSPAECTSRVPLPLVESLRNDFPGTLPVDNTAPAFGDRSLRTNEVNGLTKACIDGLADLNDNGDADLIEVQEDPIAFVNDPTSGRARINSFSYFLETHRAYVETPAGSTPKLVIEERRRCDPRDFPLHYRADDPAYNPSDAASYWRSCQRGVDPDFDIFVRKPGFDFAQWSCPDGADGCDSIPAAPPFRFALNTPTPAGAAPPEDATLCELGSTFPGDRLWRGMHHHSQFKCVRVTTAGTEDDAAARADFTGGKLRMNTCTAQACAAGDATCVESRRVVPAGKAVEPVIACTVAEAPPAVGDIGFASVEYRGYGAGFGNTPYPGGCVNEDQEFRDILCPAPQSASAPNWNIAPPNALDGYGRSTCFLGPCPQGRADCDGEPLNGCEIDATLNESCGGCPDDPSARCFPEDPDLPVQTAKHAVGQCDVLGFCQILRCDENFADCDGNPDNGCERPTTTLTDCGSCDTPCVQPGGEANCTSGTCRIETCEVGLGDCDEDEPGCESEIDIVERCGNCSTVCTTQFGQPSCVPTSDGENFECGIASCVENHEDCNKVVEDGCEVDILTDPEHCGGCGINCADLPAGENANSICAGGECLVVGCQPGFGDCDGNPDNGCEITHGVEAAFEDCRFCGDDCGFNSDTAFSECTAAGCQLGACRDGFADCNGRASDACEVNLKDSACDDRVTNVGEEVAESTCGVFCNITTGERLFSSKTGFGSKWFMGRAKEAPGLCNDDLKHRIEVIVPPGHDYDVFVYSDCGATLMTSKRTRGDATEDLTISVRDASTQDRSFNYWVEVRWVEGDTCAPYTVNFYGRTPC